MPVDLDQIVDEYLMQKSLLNMERRGPRRVGEYFPSEIGYCHRQNFFKFYNPKLHDLDTLRIFEAGIKFEEFIQEALKDNPKVKYFVPQGHLIMVVDPLEMILLTGRFDLFMQLEDDKERYLLEFKSTKDIDFVRQAKDLHKMQVHPYMPAVNARKAIILYGDKQDYATKPFIIDFDVKTMQNIIQRTKDLHKYVSTKTMPPAEAMYNKEMKWMCTRCPWYKECVEIENTRGAPQIVGLDKP